MRWDKLFSDFDLQWDREADNIQWDEERENVRAVRASMSFREVLISEHDRLGRLDLNVESFSSVIHARRLGPAWVEGVLCESSVRVIATMSAITVVSSNCGCGCPAGRLDDLPHATLGAALRKVERSSETIRWFTTTNFQSKCISGRINAVWADSVRVANSEVDSVIVPTASFVLTAGLGS